MRPIVCIHGVSERRDASGFSKPLRDECARICRKHQLEYPQWREVVWSDLSDIGAGGPVMAAADMCLDVVRYDADAELRARIISRLSRALKSNPGAVLIAHSLGSVAAVDLLCDDRCDVSALVTIGSPLGLSGRAISYRERVHRAAESLSDLEWLDIWSASDPVHTGSIAAWSAVDGAEGLDSAGYPCRSKRIDLGSSPMHAHIGYWRQPLVATWVLDLASRQS